MANPTTLTNLQDQAKDYADMTGSSFPVTARLTEYINKGLSRLHDIIVRSNENYFMSEQSISVLSGTETYSLPTDYYKTLKMWYTSNGYRYRVDKFNLDEISGFRTSPLQAGSLVHWYIPQITRLADGADTVDTILPDGWEDYVALHAASRLAVRQGDPEKVAMLARERDELLTHIIMSVEPRDEEVKVIGDYEDRWGQRMQHHSEDVTFLYNIIGDNVHVLQYSHWAY